MTEFEDFSACWPSDQLKARGLVSQIRQLVNVKDSFTRINLEREQERKQHRAQQQAKLRDIEQRRAKLSLLRSALLALFGEQNAWARGKKLEPILNDLFALNGILIREAFTLRGLEGQGVLEQIDGVIEIDGELYLVEMKWWEEVLGVGDVSQHLVRVFSRGQARGIFISSSGYTSAAINTCKESLHRIVVVLCELEEIVMLLERDGDVQDFLRKKIRAAIIDKILSINRKAHPDSSPVNLVPQVILSEPAPTFRLQFQIHALTA